MIESYLEFILGVGYFGFFAYMIIVGTFIPAPTQVLLIPAGVLISNGELDFITLILVTATGTTLGALINYSISKKYARKIIPEKNLMRINNIFIKLGESSVFLAPLMLGLGQYISLVAGLNRMNLLHFIGLVWLSNAIFDTCMVSIGYFLNEGSKAPLILSVSGAMIVVCFVYIKLKKA